MAGDGTETNLNDEPLEEDCWVPVCERRVMALALRPPEDCTAGWVEVHVRQRSTDLNT